MHATDLDVDIECPGCDGTGDPTPNDSRDVCPVCSGGGVVNRYTDPPDNEVWVGRIDYRENGPLVVVEVAGRQPIEHDETGGFNGRYGTFQPSDPIPDYQQDMLDQMGNSLGANAPYNLPDERPYNGRTLDSGDFPGGQFPADGDLTANQVLSWLRGRGDEFTATVLEDTFTQVGIL